MEEIQMKDYELRKINAGDIAPLATIMSRIGIKEFAGCFRVLQIAEAEDKDVEEIGITVMLDVASIVISNLPVCLNDVFSFVASLTGKKTEEIKALDIDVFAEIIIDICQKDEIKKVFKVASRLLK